ncbi:MAG: zinc-ribbon domain-containing protein [Alphaproteobacteria bacterium]|nr:zinc-ribbon domain-containing protein [Alphaproteobacteria bacterium]
MECPSCRTRYLVQIGLFAQGGRQVRCARCKHEWHAALPTNIDVVLPSEDFTPIPAALQKGQAAPAAPFFKPSTRPEAETPQAPPPDEPAHLPVVIKSRKWGKNLLKIAGWVALAAALLAWPMLDRQPIVKALPALRGFYDSVGLSVPPSWDGLRFDQVKSDLRYDSGTMKLYVDGVIHNTTSEVQLIPDIRAQALGPDQKVIQSWQVDAPAATIAPEGDVPFHTEVATAMEHTIEDVKLEFYARDSDSAKGGANAVE